MDIQKLEEDLRLLVKDVDKQSFIYDLLRAYKLPKASVTRLQKGDYNQAKNPDEILWKKKLFFKQVAGEDPHESIEVLRNHEGVKKRQPRFLLVTDFQTLLAVDCTTEDSLDIALTDLPAHYDFFLPWAGLEKIQVLGENPADIKAAERMGRLYDILCEDNPIDSEEERHTLNIFLSRLLFCYFAEDTGIFERKHQFTSAVASHTLDDGSDLQPYLENLFRVLDLDVPERDGQPNYLCSFPYVNGGLFAREYPVPRFSRQARRIILECGALDWKDINPDIFGSMIQAVVHTDQRGSLGMHYTSVTNIMKVIKPLFLDDLREEFEKAGKSKAKLKGLLARLRIIRIFDPACGSGNFLIIAYKELCRLEIEILKQLHGDQKSFDFMSTIKLTQFYGIELDDFAHETAKLSLWLAEHQMNMAFRVVFGEAKPTLPLQDGGNIVCGNATRMDWEEVCPKEEGGEAYILGNPPYSGSKNQSKEQKKDIQHVLKGISVTKSLDYIACWFIKAAQYIDISSKFSFVSTNSLFQGTQVPLLWPIMVSSRVEIFFSYKDFLWSNNARNNAGVTCSIVGLRKQCNDGKILFHGTTRKRVQNINPYLFEGETIFIKNRTKPLSVLPRLQIGNEAYDCGHLTFTDDEKINFINIYPKSDRFFKKVVGSSELIKGFYRWCLWIEPENYAKAIKIQGIADRIKRVREYREHGGMNARSCADRPYQFRWVNRAKESQIVLPVVSSQRREYIPMDFVDKKGVEK
ncbi:MAG: class I SAM-dependent DNA methyltransferase [Candidatus Electrothrix sp. GM3_4]|nr:class I SAM-dependent DNA methyltransferase [Candidatus Electrothrix sp. GM3_4]